MIFAPNGNTFVSAATVMPSTACTPLAVMPSDFPQHFTHAQYPVNSKTAVLFGLPVSVLPISVFDESMQPAELL